MKQASKLPLSDYKDAAIAEPTLENCMLVLKIFDGICATVGWTPGIDCCADVLESNTLCDLYFVCYVDAL